MTFTKIQKKHFQILKDLLFDHLTEDEVASISIHAEDSDFIRMNQSQVRQATHVQQIDFKIKLEYKKKQISNSFSGTGDLHSDKQSLLKILERCRQNILQLPDDPHFIPMENNGHSDMELEADRPTVTEVISIIARHSKNCDLAGIYCAGPIIQADANSLGQNHWFATDQYFFDYSIYRGPKAAKGFVSDIHWNTKHLEHSIDHTLKFLDQLSLPEQKIQPGKYKCYLDPAAVAELLGTMSYGGFSQQSFQLGHSPFRKLGDKSITLSPLFSLQENYEMGLAPKFNSLGEVCENHISLIHKGEWIQFLTSTRTAKEYHLRSNFADSNEFLRSTEISPGTLKENEILKALGTGFYLSNLHYCNWSDMQSARMTGMTRFACFWVEDGQIKGPISDLRFDVSLYEVFGENLLGVTQNQELFPNIGTHYARGLGGFKVPGMLVKDFNFTL